MPALDLVLKRWPIFAALISAAMLAVAHGFQTFGHLAPCHLCLKQREVYWAAMALGAAGAIFGFVRPVGNRIAAALLACVFTYGCYLAGFHAGAEWHWWPAPEGCASTGYHVTIADLQALMAGGGGKPPACDVAPGYVLGLSMAGWNFVASVILVLTSLAAALRPGAKVETRA